VIVKELKFQDIISLENSAVVPVKPRGREAVERGAQ
jgi:hypothetical protein